MDKSRGSGLARVLLGLVFAGVMVGAVNAETVQEIKFDIGRNIVETAKNSGVPSFQSGKAYTRLSYSVSDIPAGIPARFTRPGYEVSVEPLYAFTLYTDEEDYKDLEVFHASLMFDLNVFETHEEARLHVEKVLAQFQQGKWQRHYGPNNARLTGRSSYLNEAGELDASATGALDPSYRIPKSEWAVLAEQGLYWTWVGDGVLATFSVQLMPGYIPGKLNYDLSLDFRNLARVEKYTAINEAIRLKEGDEKGWNSTAKHHAAMKEIAATNRILEANATKRGDSVLPGP